MMSRSTATALIPLLLVLLVGEAMAVSKKTYRYARMADYQDCSFRGLVLTDDGSWRIGERWQEALADSADFFTGMAGDGRSLLIAAGGTPNRLLLFDRKKGGAKEIAAEPELIFSSVASIERGVWAIGTGPAGRVLRIDDAGRAACSTIRGRSSSGTCSRGTARSGSRLAGAATSIATTSSAVREGLSLHFRT